MIINLYEILSIMGKESTVEVKLDCEQMIYHGEQLAVVCDQPFQVVMKHVKKGVVRIEFDLQVTVGRTCSRCLEEVKENHDLHIVRMIDFENKTASIDNSDEYDEISYIEDCNLDVDLLILDELYTVIPIKVLCKDDCKGICKVCGTNLNKSTCNCDQTVPDPRMAVFSDIFNQFKEV